VQPFACQRRRDSPHRNRWATTSSGMTIRFGEAEPDLGWPARRSDCARPAIEAGASDEGVTRGRLIGVAPGIPSVATESVEWFSGRDVERLNVATNSNTQEHHGPVL
jgi:hypothetical protein